MQVKKPKKEVYLRKVPIPGEDKKEVLEVEVGRADEHWKVVGTLMTVANYRTCVAIIETQVGVAYYVADMKQRKREGLDPLAGMDCVESYSFTPEDEP